jgi:hypothetical protein
MSTETESAERAKWSPLAIAAALLLLILFGVITVGTMRGCFFVDPQEAAKREEERKKNEDPEKKKKEQYDISFPIVQPSEPETAIQAVKPGHWVTASQKMRANFDNFVGDSRISIVNNQNQPYPIASTPFVVRSSRPVLLMKGRQKATETTIFVPTTDQAINLTTELEERGLGFSIAQPRTPLSRMPSYQYYFVVLAKEPSRYSFIKTLDSVKVPFDGESDADDTEDPLHYRVVQLDAGKTTPLPDNPLTWTNMAYLLWDEVDPGDPVTPEQERALVDWLHWGGQLIINGPDSLDLLKDSFLAPYLPATNGGSRKIAADENAIAQLNEGWMISTKAAPGEPVRPTVPWSAINLAVHADAQELPGTGGLFVERRVGRGRIVVSAIQLAERDLVNWRSGFESLFNACLLRRPPRQFRPGHFGGVTLAWADEGLRARRLDARLTTNLRYFARDLGVETAYQFQDVPDESAQFRFNPNGQPQTMREYRAPNNAGGIGAWNDFNATASAARTALREAAGVEVPGADFVILCLAVYLVALVPLNWLIFNTLGRTEWAWIAAPFIAIIGTLVIVQRAQLDIGFVRAQTEIAVLELQPDHPRAQLSRYTAMYTSLSTTYNVQYDNPTTLIAPFPTSADFQLLPGQGLTPIDFQRYENVKLAGLPISSNSTGMVHSEQMHALEGPIRIGQSVAGGGGQIENRSNMALHSACVVRRPTAAEESQTGRKLEGMWIGQLLPGSSVSLPKRLPVDKTSFVAERAGEAKSARAPRLNLEPMFKLALDPRYMEPGEMRLVARVDEVLPGETIEPVASQIRGATLVVAHVEYAPLAAPQRDFNTRQDIKARENDDEQPEALFN